MSSTVKRYVWVIDMFPDEGEFDTKEAAVARAWACTAPGAQRWQVSKRESKEMTRVRDEVFGTGPGVAVSFGGAVDTIVDLPDPQLTPPGTIFWTQIDGEMLVVLHGEDGNYWAPMVMGKIPMDVYADIKRWAEEDH
jgi:hypothetical protein